MAKNFSIYTRHRLAVLSIRAEAKVINFAIHVQQLIIWIKISIARTKSRRAFIQSAFCLIRSQTVKSLLCLSRLRLFYNSFLVFFATHKNVFSLPSF
jgi:hypothetical protein